VKGSIDQHFSTVSLGRSEAYSGTVLKLHAISLSKVEHHVEKGHFPQPDRTRFTALPPLPQLDPHDYLTNTRVGACA
jgi:hypothetical protein